MIVNKNSQLENYSIEISKSKIACEANPGNKDFGGSINFGKLIVRG